MFDLIEYDAAKDAANRAKHKLALSDARHLEEIRTTPDIRGDYGEKRFATWGRLRSADVICIWTPRAGAARVISLFRARTRTLRSYGFLS